MNQKENFLIRAQTQYLHCLVKFLGADGKSPEEILADFDNPKVIKTAEEIEKEVEEKFKKYFKKVD